MGVAGNQCLGIVEVNIEVDKIDQEARRRAAVGYMAVGKLPQVECTVLEKMIHSPHLV